MAPNFISCTATGYSSRSYLGNFPELRELIGGPGAFHPAQTAVFTHAGESYHACATSIQHHPMMLAQQYEDCSH